MLGKLIGGAIAIYGLGVVGFGYKMFNNRDANYIGYQVRRNRVAIEANCEPVIVDSSCDMIVALSIFMWPKTGLNLWNSSADEFRTMILSPAVRPQILGVIDRYRGLRN